MSRRQGDPIFARATQRKDCEYTDRQLNILNDDIPLSVVLLKEITTLMRKAEARGDDEYYEIARLMYEVKSVPTGYTPNMTVKEAKTILQLLTPWKINWK